MRNALLTFGLLIVILLSACSPQGGSAGADLAGEWTLTTLNGQPPIAGSTITVKFENGEVGGNSGCNSYGGSYTVSGSKLSTSELVMTEMACLDAGVMDQESAYLQALNQAAGFTIADSRLEIQDANGDTTLVFTAK